MHPSLLARFRRPQVTRPDFAQAPGAQAAERLAARVRTARVRWWAAGPARCHDWGRKHTGLEQGAPSFCELSPLSSSHSVPAPPHPSYAEARRFFQSYESELR